MHFRLGLFGNLANPADHIASAVGIADDLCDAMHRLVDHRCATFHQRKLGFAMSDNRDQPIHLMGYRGAHLAKGRYARDVSEFRLGGVQCRLRMLGRGDVIVGLEYCPGRLRSSRCNDQRLPTSICLPSLLV